MLFRDSWIRTRQIDLPIWLGYVGLGWLCRVNFCFADTDWINSLDSKKQDDSEIESLSDGDAHAGKGKSISYCYHVVQMLLDL